MSGIGLVLGAGGLTGSAYHAGVLAALSDTGWDPRTAQLIVGTSAGSIAAAVLRAGISAGDLFAFSVDEPLSAAGAARLATATTPIATTTGDDVAPARRRRMASPEAFVRVACRPWTARPLTLVAAALPEGTLPSELITDSIGPLFGARWPDMPTWICALRLSDTRRVVFGREGEPLASMGDAVAASCAIPAVFRPVLIGGHRYVDGGAHSPTNLDTVAGLGLDLIVVVSPLSFAGAVPRLAPDAPIRQFGRARLSAETRTVRRKGTAVVSFQPTEADQRVMGPNAMDGSRSPDVAYQARESAAEHLADAEVRSRLAALWA